MAVGRAARIDGAANGADHVDLYAGDHPHADGQHVLRPSSTKCWTSAIHPER